MEFSDIQIRPAQAADAELLARLGSQTFLESYAEFNTKKDMDEYVAAHFKPELIQSLLSREDLFCFIAWCGEEAIGYLQLSPATVPNELKEKQPLEIERIYVVKAWHDRKVGAALMRFSIQLAKERNYDSLWLGVWEKNNRAIAFYTRWGFEIIGVKTFMLGNDLQDDHLMWLEF